MGALVRTLKGDNVAADLKAAYEVLAHAYLEHRGGGVGAADVKEPRNLDAVVRATEKPMDLRPAREKCRLIGTDFERPAEAFNNLGHMFVLCEALPLLAARGLVANVCAPTQQSVDEAGAAVPDLGGASWALEAFGGVNIANNGKLAKDFQSLAKWSGRRTLIACRPEAWRLARVLRVGDSSVVHARGKMHGGPLHTMAKATKMAETETVIITELTGIVMLPSSGP